MLKLIIVCAILSSCSIPWIQTELALAEKVLEVVEQPVASN